MLKMVAIYWFYMYLTHKSYKSYAGFGFTRYSYVQCSTSVIGVVGNIIPDLYSPCHQKLILKSMCCLNKTIITTLNQAVITADCLKFSF